MICILLQFVECNQIERVDCSTEIVPDISDGQEGFEPVTNDDHYQNRNEDICQITSEQKKLPTRLIHYVCNICNKIIKGKFTLKTHLTIHSGERPYSCEICNKSFAQKKVLHEHQLLHSGYKPHACNICEKSFAKKGTLMKHIVVHTGDRKHSCDICGKRFAQRSGFLKHRVSHTGERPYTCSICCKTFTQKFILKRHTEKLHSDFLENFQSKVNN
jgi:Putative transcriptional repressor regulating G2/M transition